MPQLTVRAGARSVVHPLDAPVALEALCPSPPPPPYHQPGWQLRPDGCAVVLVAPGGAVQNRVGPGDALALGEVTLAVEGEDRPGGRGSTDRLADASSVRLMLQLPGGRRVALGTRALTLGRDPRCDVVIDEPSVSAVHCRVVPARGAWEIRDAGSTNGTRVRGVRVAQAVLEPGVPVALGRARLWCLLDPREQDPTGAAASAAAVLVGNSAGMEAVRDAIARYAARSYPVLIHGETGSGKELVARLLHERSGRARGPFVAINAATIAPELVESELFGHERGAFTGANGRRRGVFEEASGGTLFLDEIGELPLGQQAKLLRVLETGEVRRVGAEGSVRVDVRVVCATHRDLNARAHEGLFRLDLLYRLDVLRVQLPPLRERHDDLPVLCRHLLGRVAAELGAPRRLDDAALASLLAYHWPGNVRELYGVLRRAAVEADGERIGAEHLSLGEASGAVAAPREPAARASGVYTPAPPHRHPRELDAARLRALVEACGGNISRAAASVGLARSTLRDRLSRG